MNKTIASLILLVFFCSCAEKPSFDESSEREKILALHHAQRKYHFEKDSLACVQQMSDQFVSVNRGKITHPTVEENLARFSSYFSAVEFEKWDDLAEPIIRFSDDGTMAFTIVDKEVSVRYEHQEGEPEESTTHFSWVTIYRKYADDWKIDCVASTNEPSVTSNL